MIRATRIAAMAQDHAGLVTDWNITPNVAYTLVLGPGASACGVVLLDESGTTIIATGAAATGEDQPATLYPRTGQEIGMLDAELGYHLLISSVGTEPETRIRIGPAVDLPDEVHPIYSDDDLALVRATAVIDGAAHYVDEVTVSCPNGLGAWLGDVVSVLVDGVAVVGQVDSITWTATPDSQVETAVIRRHVPIAPEV